MATDDDEPPKRSANKDATFIYVGRRAARRAGADFDPLQAISFQESAFARALDDPVLLSRHQPTLALHGVGQELRPDRSAPAVMIVS